jgi:hypothetical protein
MSNTTWNAFSTIAALGLALNSGISRADPVQTTDPEMTVVSSDGMISCDGDTGLCTVPARPQPPSPPIHHHYRSFAHHLPVRAHPAAVEVPHPILVAASGAPNCTGANAWSLLCPGSQLIGVSY